jgi:ketosteroid isomerase-like protein
MSQENVEVVRAGFAAWNAGDMDALRELHNAGVIMRPAGGVDLQRGLEATGRGPQAPDGGTTSSCLTRTAEMDAATAACQGVGHCEPLRRSADTRCRVTPKLLAICSIVRPSA